MVVCIWHTLHWPLQSLSWKGQRTESQLIVVQTPRMGYEILQREGDQSPEPLENTEDNIIIEKWMKPPMKMILLKFDVINSLIAKIVSRWTVVISWKDTVKAKSATRQLCQCYDTLQNQEFWLSGCLDYPRDSRVTPQCVCREEWVLAL